MIGTGSPITTTHPVVGRRPFPSDTTSFQFAEIAIGRRPQLEQRRRRLFGCR